jgi:hypothetical protein
VVCTSTQIKSPATVEANQAFIVKYVLLFIDETGSHMKNEETYGESGGAISSPSKLIFIYYLLFNYNRYRAIVSTCVTRTTGCFALFTSTVLSCCTVIYRAVAMFQQPWFLPTTTIRGGHASLLISVYLSG